MRTRPKFDDNSRPRTGTLGGSARFHLAGNVSRACARQMLYDCLALSSPLIRSLQTDTISIQNIVQGYDAFELVYISTANNWEDVQVGRSHTVQRKMKRVIQMDVGEIRRVNKLSQSFSCGAFGKGVLETTPADNTHYPSLIGNWPTAELTRLCFFKSLSHCHLRGQKFRGTAHRMDHLALPLLLTCLGAW